MERDPFYSTFYLLTLFSEQRVLWVYTRAIACHLLVLSPPYWSFLHLLIQIPNSEAFVSPNPTFAGSGLPNADGRQGRPQVAAKRLYGSRFLPSVCLTPRLPAVKQVFREYLVLGSNNAPVPNERTDWAGEILKILEQVRTRRWLYEVAAFF
jgi:hypothetical protein